MQIRRVGHHGLAVSALGLGTLTWGRDTDELEAADILRTFLDSGGTTLDIPSDWASTAFKGRVAAVGNVIKEVGLKPGDLVTLFHSGTLPEPTGPTAHSGAAKFGPPISKRNLLASLDAGLAALGADHVDLWMIHGPHRGVHIEEIVAVTGHAIRTGRAAYVGLSGLNEWDMGSAVTLAASQPHGSGEDIASTAAPFSLLSASAAGSLIPHSVAHGLGFIALSPLAQGVLTGKYRHSTPPDSRAASTHLSSLMDGYFEARAARVVEAVARTAKQLGASPTEVSLAWVLAQHGVTGAIVGPRTERQLDQILGATEMRLQRELRDVLFEVSLR